LKDSKIVIDSHLVLSMWFIAQVNSTAYECDARVDATSTAVWKIIIPINFLLSVDVIDDSLYLNNCQFYN